MTLKNEDLLDLKQINTFLAIVELGSFSAAARRLEISQPSVSQQVKKLEERLGRPVLKRGSGVTLTDDGEALLVFARAIISLSDQAQAHFSDPSFAGSVRLGFNEDFALTVLPKVLSLFMKMHGNFKLVITCSFDNDELFRALDADEIDVVIVRAPPESSRGEVVRRWQTVWFGQSRDTKMLVDPVPIIVSTAPSARRELVFEALAKAGRTWTIPFASPNLAMLDAAISAGIGVAVSLKGFKMISAQELDAECGLPQLGELALCLDVGTRNRSPTILLFADFLRQTLLSLDINNPRSV